MDPLKVFPFLYQKGLYSVVMFSVLKKKVCPGKFPGAPRVIYSILLVHINGAAPDFIPYGITNLSSSTPVFGSGRELIMFTDIFGPS